MRASADRSSQTRFPLCSMTKHIMALALIRLLYDHGLNDNTPIRQILPRFRLTNEADGTTTVTFAHLLSHTTGIDADSGMWSEIEARKVDLVSLKHRDQQRTTADR